MLIDQLPSANPNLTDETVTEQGTNLFKTTWQKIRDLFFGSHASFASDVSVGGVLDVVPRRCYAALSSAGWYRVMVYNAPDSGAITGGSGLVVDFNIQRAGRAENHSVTLRCASTGLISFVNEQSKSYTVYIDKIRYVYDSTNLKAYVDIHYTGSDLASTQIGVEYTVHASSLDMQERIVSGNLLSAATSPVSPETVLTEYTFTPNTNNPIVFSPLVGTADFGGCWYSLCNDLVTVSVGLTGLTNGTPHTIYTLPSNLCPKDQACIVGSGATYTTYSGLFVRSDGKIQVYVPSGGLISAVVTYMRKR